MKKFELATDIVTRNIYGRTLYCIRALKDTKWAQKGDLGGYVESEDCLSQSGDAWIAGETAVFKGSIVEGNALVDGMAKVSESRISGNAQISDAAVVQKSEVSGNAKIYGDAHVFCSKVSGNAEIYDQADLYDVQALDKAHIFGNAQLWYSVSVRGRARIFGNAVLENNVEVYDNAEISEFACVNCIDTRKIELSCRAWNDPSKLMKADPHPQDTVRIYGKAKVHGCACILAGSEVFGNAEISDNVRITNNAKVHGSLKLQGNTLIGRNADIARDSNYLVCAFGEYKREMRNQDVMTFFRNADGGLTLQYYNRNDRDHTIWTQKDFDQFFAAMRYDAKFYTHGCKLNVYKQAVDLAQCVVDTSLT